MRRSTGGGDAPAQRRRLDVAIYDEAGTALLRDATGGRWGVKDLSYSSLLPGGFATCSFRLERPTARNWPGRAGLKCVVRRGNRVLWWGWVEDLQRAIRGGIETIDVTCIGPYQQLGQRLCSLSYTGTVYGDNAVADQLRALCTDISIDYSQIALTSVNIAPLTWSYRPVSDLVKLVCDAGNSSGQPMLFEIEAPTEKGLYQPTSMVNSDLETGTSTPTGWAYTATSGSSGAWTRNDYHSQSRSLLMQRTSGTGVQTGYWQQTGVACAASTSYIVDFWARFGPVAAESLYFEVRWKNGGGTYISSSTGTTHTYASSTDWLRYIEAVTSPVGAASFDIRLYGSLPNSAFALIYWDDVYVYVGGAAQVMDTKPRARMWARDLTATDYYLYTAELDSALAANQTTRELANDVLAKYGSSYTTASQDATSEADYRQRDAVVDAGSDSSVTVANAVRDTYLARHKNPADEPGAFRLSRPGAVRTEHGAMVWPEDLRAGDRMQIADGPLAGTIVMLKAVEYSGGTVTCTPERPDDVPILLAKV